MDDVFLSGSYDHTLKLFDARMDKSVMTMDHGHPVESLLLYPSEGLLVSAGSQPHTLLIILENIQSLYNASNINCYILY